MKQKWSSSVGGRREFCKLCTMSKKEKGDYYCCSCAVSCLLPAVWCGGGGTVVQLLQREMWWGRGLNSGHLMHLHALTKTMSISWNCCRCQQNLMGPGSVFQRGAPTRTHNHMDPANHNSQHLRSKTILSIQSKLVTGNVPEFLHLGRDRV